MKHKKVEGFSLIELVVGLLIVSIAIAAFAPVMNKRVKADKAAISTKLTESCARFGFDASCKLCYGKNKCAVCIKGCPEGVNLNAEKCTCGG